jgi:hypothetical protein
MVYKDPSLSLALRLDAAKAASTRWTRAQTLLSARRFRGGTTKFGGATIESADYAYGSTSSRLPACDVNVQSVGAVRDRVVLRSILTTFAAIFIFQIAAAPALAQRKVAFVVGIDKYDNLGSQQQLQRAVNDARSVGTAFASLGFEVVRAEYVSRTVPMNSRPLVHLLSGSGRMSPG